jgi:predicted Zn-dependent protease
LADGFVIEGTVLLSIEKYADAIKAFEAGMEKKKGNTAAVGRFTAQRKAGQEKEAFTALQEWTDRKDDPAVRYVLANAYLKAKRYDDSIREFEILLAAGRTTPIMLNNLAWLYGEKGSDRAVVVAEKALKRAPGSAAVMDTAGWILVRNDQLERGTRLLEKASNLAPKQGDIVYHYAAALEKSGRADEARRTLRELLGSGIGFAESGKAEALLKQLGG